MGLSDWMMYPGIIQCHSAGTFSSLPLSNLISSENTTLSPGLNCKISSVPVMAPAPSLTGVSKAERV